METSYSVKTAPEQAFFYIFLLARIHLMRCGKSHCCITARLLTSCIHCCWRRILKQNTNYFRRLESACH